MAIADALPAVSVIISFFKPDIDLARRQVASLLAQDGVNLTGFAVLDGEETGEDPELLALIRDAGFDIIVNATPLGVRQAFCEGLNRALADADHDRFFCYADQDDEWHPDKLSRLVACAAATQAALVHCDARVVAGDGTVITQSLHQYESRREPADLLGMILLNTVTGMTALFPAATARLARDVMASYDGSFLHDHVTAIAAASLGPVIFIDDVLVDYIQHGGNHLGAKLHRNMIRRRAMGVGPLAIYRDTSDSMFRDRRAVALLLDRHGKLPADLRTMFLTSQCRGFWNLSWTYTRLLWKMFIGLDFRRWVLGLRMMDAALFVHYPSPRS